MNENNIEHSTFNTQRSTKQPFGGAFN